VFQHAIELLDEYYRQHANDTIGAFDSHLVQEIRARLRQLEHLYAEVVARQQQLLDGEGAKTGPQPADTNRIILYTHLGTPPPVNPAPEVLPLTTQERVLLAGEAFYYLAHRVRTILEQGRGGLPGMRSLRSQGVVRVRNNLLEHANKKGGTSVFSFSVSSPVGLRLRPLAVKGTPQPYVDEGILWNANEFRTDLEDALRDALGGR
jgi:hypothetical protein